MTDLESWLALVTEEPTDPDFPICDPHHHLWDRPDNRYLVPDLMLDIGGGHRVTQTVFLECKAMYKEDGPAEMRPVGETEFVVGQASESDENGHRPTKVAAGIVGFADLTLGAGVASVLEAHVAAGKGRFRGIRHSAVWDPSPEILAYGNPSEGLLLSPSFREGFACLHKYGLSFDAWLYHPQLMDLADLARAFPDVPIVLNHVGGLIRTGPYEGKREEVFRSWKQGISELASCHNVFVKLGGLGMPRCGFGWHEQSTPPTSVELARAMSPYFLFCIEQFGADRCMFESNFPVDKVSYSYNVLWNAFKRVAGSFSDEEKVALFRGTAERFYRLSVNSSDSR